MRCPHCGEPHIDVDMRQGHNGSHAALKACVKELEAHGYDGYGVVTPQASLPQLRRSRGGRDGGRNFGTGGSFRGPTPNL
jgi:hypothetical protein